MPSETNNGAAKPADNADRERRKHAVVQADDGQTFKVYPLGMAAMDANPSQVATMLAAAVTIGPNWATIHGNKDLASAVWKLIAPVCGRDAMRLAAACTLPNPIEADAPFDVAGRIMIEWINLSFIGGDKVKNFFTAADDLARRTAGERLGLWMMILSNWWQQVSTAPTSSPGQGQTAAPTPAGASPSSAIASPPSDDAAVQGTGS